MTLLPPNAGPLERGLDAAAARISAIPAPLRDLWNPATCPLSLIPYLAFALSIDGWSPDWPESVKRARVAQAIEIQRIKGTAKSVRDVIRAFGGAVALREWYQHTPPGEPHTFDMMLNLTEATGDLATAKYVDDVVAEVNRTKPVRSHFTFTQALNARGAFGPVVAARPAVFLRLPMAAPAA